MIVPAKFQMAEPYQQCASKICNYGKLQREVVPYIKTVHYWFDACDIFPIKLLGGICVYLVDHKAPTKAAVFNHQQQVPEFNNLEYRDLNNRDTFNNMGFSIYKKIASQNTFKSLKLNYNPDHKYTVYGCNMGCPSNRIQVGGSCLFTCDGDSFVTGVCSILETGSRLDELQGRDEPIFSSDSLAECKSFVQYFYTKFFRFLSFILISKQSGINSDWWWRYIPDPGPFDHLFTDEELYKKYGLSDTDQSLINRIIRDRYKSNPSCDQKDFWILNREQLL